MGVPLVVMCTLLASACVAALVVHVVAGHGLYPALISFGSAAFFVTVANWTLQLRRTVREWSLAVAERQRLSGA